MGLLKKCFMHRRGGLTCPPETRCVCKNNPFIHFVYGDQNQVAQAVLLVQNGTLGRACGAVEK